MWAIEVCVNRKGVTKDHLKPLHVAYLDKSDGVDEEEFLFSPYSVFTVRSATFVDNTHLNSQAYHVIHLNAPPADADALQSGGADDRRRTGRPAHPHLAA